MEENIIKHNYKVGREERRSANGHSSFLVFFTGLSGSGKSTLACALEQRLFQDKIRTYVLDGDNIRRGINRDLKFSPEDRSENNRRIGEIANLFVDAGMVVLAAFVAPYEKDRNVIRDTVGSENYIEVFVNTSLTECVRRDVKGLYNKAMKGEIKDMTGISSPYEVPLRPDIILTERDTVEQAVDTIYELIRPKLKLK